MVNRYWVLLTGLFLAALEHVYEKLFFLIGPIKEAPMAQESTED